MHLLFSASPPRRAPETPLGIPPVPPPSAPALLRSSPLSTPHDLLLMLGLPWWLSWERIRLHAGGLGSIPRWEDALEKGKAPHSSILAWRIPRTVQSIGSQSRTRLSNSTLTDTEGTCGSPRRIHELLLQGSGSGSSMTGPCTRSRAAERRSLNLCN